jgi:FMN-dependent NADH-azoreductase
MRNVLALAAIPAASISAKTSVDTAAAAYNSGNDGSEIDIADILAATAPNLDIDTATGPANDNQGSGVDNNDR